MLLGFGSLAIEKWTIPRSRFFLRYVFSAIIILVGIDFTFIGLPVMKPASLVGYL